MSDPLLSICSFKTDWSITLILSQPPRKLSCSLSLFPPHLVIKEPLPQIRFCCHSWTDFSSVQTRTSAHVSGVSFWSSSCLFKVSILKLVGLESLPSLSHQLISQVLWTLWSHWVFLSFPSTVPSSAEVALRVSLYRPYLNSTIISPWQKWHLRYILFYSNWKWTLWTCLMILWLTYTFPHSGLHQHCENHKVKQFYLIFGLASLLVSSASFCFLLLSHFK